MSDMPWDAKKNDNNYCCPVNMCKGLQSQIFLLYNPPLERELTAVRRNVVFETLHDFYRTAIILNGAILSYKNI